ncbi:unnamed protein product, partial [Oikopleura dioica]
RTIVWPRMNSRKSVKKKGGRKSHKLEIWN